MKKIILKDKTEVSMREPKVRDIVALDDVIGEANKEVHLIANVCQLDLEYVLDLGFDDFKKLQEPVQSFLV